MSDEFYVGYHERSPAGTRAFVRRVVLALLVVAIAIAFLITSRQGPFRPSVFEFGVEREFVGWLSSDPVPSLFARVPGHHDAEASTGVCGANYSIYPLTEGGTKFGGADLVSGLEGQLVRLRGSLIYLGGSTMIDAAADSIAPVNGGERGPAPVTEDLGEQTLSGEIVDSKCHFGLMDPSTGKVHRGCAVRCISGGIPPMLHVEDDEGRVANLLLVGRDGRAIHREVLPMVGEPVRVVGRVARFENLLVLYAKPEAIERL